MLWKSSPSKPPELPESVVASTALRLGLDYWEREPFRLDGVFYRRGTAVEHNFPFPILVAIEHENDFRTFHTEITRLLSIRCPLKVGITYEPRSASSHNQSEKDLNSLKACISRRNQEISQIITEDAKAEYLFLVGVERNPFELTWFALSFRATDGPEESPFLEV
jgi:hypothetical protein